MIRIPAFQARFLVQTLPSGEIVLVSENGVHVLSGSVYERVAPLIDGRRSIPEIVSRLAPDVSAEKVCAALERLEAKSYICEAEVGLPRREAAFWEILGADPASVRERLHEVAMSVHGPEPELCQAVKQALAALGIRVEREGAFRIVVSTDYTCPDLAVFNREALENGKPWVLLKPLGIRPWIGPLLVPAETACWACMVHRIKENRWIETSLWGAQYHSGWPASSIAALPTTCGAAVTLAATEIARWAAGQCTNLVGALWTLDFASFRLQRHAVARRPQCPCCGQPAARTPTTKLCGSAGMAVRASLCGLRELDATVTLAHLERQLSPITGIAHDLTKVGADDEMQVYAARHVRALPVKQTRSRLYRSPGEVAGKGWTDAEARASCLAEAVERYSAVFQGDEPRFVARYRDVAERAVHPSALVGFSDSQYFAGAAGGSAVLNRFRDDEPIEWVPARAIVEGRIRFLPAAYVYLDYVLPDGHCFCVSDTNGCAAGNVIAEAVLQGLCELVERDAIAIWWYNRIRRPAVDTASFSDPRFELARRQLTQRGRSLSVLDATTDLGIPAFVAVSHDAEGRGLAFGAGAHPDPHIACGRAISEVLQTSCGSPDQARSVETHEYTLPADGNPRGAQDFPRFEPSGLTSAVAYCAQRLTERGVEAVVIDLTRPDTGLSVVRVAAAGLRPLGRRLGPGRLYDVPLTMGWLPHPTSEDDMNHEPFRF